MIGRLRQSSPQRLLAARGIPLLGLALGAAWTGAVVVWAAAPQADTAQADGALEDPALLYWLSRSRWWQHIPEPPGSPVVTEATANSLAVSWAAAESLAFEVLRYDIAYRAAGSEAFLQRTGNGPGNTLLSSTVSPKPRPTRFGCVPGTSWDPATGQHRVLVRRRARRTADPLRRHRTRRRYSRKVKRPVAVFPKTRPRASTLVRP